MLDFFETDIELNTFYFKVATMEATDTGLILV